MFSHLVVSKIKERITNNMSEFQVAKPGHRPQENLFVLKSIMALHEKYKEPLILQLMDLEKFFDKENLFDVLGEAYANEVKGKEYRLLYNINKRREITVLTPVGESKSEEVEEGLSQGTLESGILSAGSIDRGLTTFFEDSSNELYYNKVRVQGLGYQDDIMRGSKTLEDTQAGIRKMEAMAETKLLNFNMKKSCLIVLGSDKVRKEVEKEMEAHPILLFNKPMQIKDKDKYLGDEITVNCANSVTATINKRKGLDMLAITDIADIINNPRSHTT